ncbi:MAG TPA: PIN domain-containing protein [Gemmataceae bacterium]|jgi:tRNA(fMet)-specific endonuclease VapC|nr:PIN domain-containing protein [Gemmataceae bacterium]
MSYLLDANAFIDPMRNGPKSTVTVRMLASPPRSIRLCSVVRGELIYGAIRSGPANEPANRARIAHLSVHFGSVPYDDAAAEEYGKVRAYLTNAGQLIGANDMLIAAIAPAYGMTLVTHNTAEFSRVPGLKLEDWQ